MIQRLDIGIWWHATGLCTLAHLAPDLVRAKSGTRSDLYNYGTAHLLFSTNLGYGFKGLGGVQAGLRLGGSSNPNVGTEYSTGSVDPAALNFDAGLLLGANYMINERIGLRASYYL